MRSSFPGSGVGVGLGVIGCATGALATRRFAGRRFFTGAAVPSPSNIIPCAVSQSKTVVITMNVHKDFRRTTRPVPEHKGDIRPLTGLVVRLHLPRRG
jgi:hypothetical protein